MKFETLLYEIEDRVVTLTLNRPERYNSFNITMAEELHKAWGLIKDDPAINCVILTGAGEKALCTGVDVNAGSFEVEDKSALKKVVAYLKMTAIQNRCWKPVITAVNGMVCGGGLHFIADSDIVVCADHATFFDTHVAFGLISGLEPVGLARRMPLEAVMRLALLGGSERMTAQQAMNLGMVGEVVPQDQLMIRAKDIASKIAAHSPTALAQSKRAIWQSLDAGLSDALKNTWEIIADHTEHPDHIEGPTAKAEKRPPVWGPYKDS